MEEVNKVIERGEKVVIFTHFLAMMDLLQVFLDKNGIKHISLFGAMNQKQRKNVIEQFGSQNQDDSEKPPVLIVSIKAGGQGLN